MSDDVRRPCVTRNSLLSQLRGSFVPSIRALSLGFGDISIVDPEPNRIYLRISIAKSGMNADIAITGRPLAESFFLQFQWANTIEFTADTTPGLVTQGFTVINTAGGLQVSVIEILA